MPVLPGENALCFCFLLSSILSQYWPVWYMNKIRKEKQTNKTKQNKTKTLKITLKELEWMTVITILFALFTKFNQIRMIFNIVYVHCWSLYTSHFLN